MGTGVLSYHTIVSKYSRMGILMFLKNLIQDPSTINMTELKRLREMDPRLCAHCLAEQLHFSYTSMGNHVHDSGFSWTNCVWLPYKLIKSQIQKRVDAFTELLSSYRTNEWLYDIITGDEKCILYVNYTRKRQ